MMPKIRIVEHQQGRRDRPFDEWFSNVHEFPPPRRPPAPSAGAPCPPCPPCPPCLRLARLGRPATAATTSRAAASAAAGIRSGRDAGAGREAKVTVGNDFLTGGHALCNNGLFPLLAVDLHVPHLGRAIRFHDVYVRALLRFLDRRGRHDQGIPIGREQ